MTADFDSSFDHELPRDLRDALDSMNTPDPRPEFRSKLRGDFVAGEIQSSDTMVEAALDEWTAPVASDAFRARCREAFLTAASPAAATVTQRSPLRRFLPLAAAAVAAALIVPELFGRAGDWEQLEGGSLAVDGRTVSDAGPTRAIVRSGSCSVKEGGERVLLCYRKRFLIEADPGAKFTYLEPRDSTIGLSLSLASGGLRVSSKSKTNLGVEIRTPDAVVVMRGEAIGLDVFDDRGTCICCLDGDVEVDPVVEGVDPFLFSSGSSMWLPRGSDEIKLMRDELHHKDVLEKIRNSARRYFY